MVSRETKKFVRGLSKEILKTGLVAGVIYGCGEALESLTKDPYVLGPIVNFLGNLGAALYIRKGAKRINKEYAGDNRIANDVINGATFTAIGLELLDDVADHPDLKRFGLEFIDNLLDCRGLTGNFLGKIQDGARYVVDNAKDYGSWKVVLGGAIANPLFQKIRRTFS